MNLKIVIILVLIQVIFPEPCIVYENSTLVDVPLFVTTIDPNIPPQIIYDPSTIDISKLQECIEVTPTTNVLYVIKNLQTLKGFNTNDVMVSTWLTFGRGYTGGLCENPLTATIALGCKINSAAGAFYNTTIDFVYPYANDPLLQSRVDLNSTLISQIIQLPNLLNNTHVPELNLSGVFAHTYTYSGIQSMYSSYNPNTIRMFQNSINSIYETDYRETKRAFYKAVKSIKKPFQALQNLYKSGKPQELIKNYLSNVGNDIHETVGNLGNMMYHYETVRKMHISGGSFYKRVNTWLHHMNMNDYKKSKGFNYKHHRDLKSNWVNLADPNPVIELTDPVAVFNGLASIGSWAVWSDSLYNQGKCLQQPDGSFSPWMPVVTLQCKAPIFKGTTEIVIWSPDFDPHNPQCDEYYKFWTGVWFKMAMNIVFNWLGPWFITHPGLIPLFGFLVYDVDRPGFLPANAKPCVYVNPPMWLVSGSILYFIFFLWGMISRISQKVQESIFPNQKKPLIGLPDITKMIPPSDVTIQKLTQPLNNLTSGDPTQLLQGGFDTSQFLQTSNEFTPQKRTKIPKFKAPKVKLKFK